MRRVSCGVVVVLVWAVVVTAQPLEPFAGHERTLPEPAARPAAAAGLPNVLIVLCDDLGYGDTSLTGHPAIRTPRLERLRAEGAWFSDFYSAANICSPSRAALLTGRMPYRLGVYSFIRDAQDFVHLPYDEVTLPQVLRRVGYECAMVGKWHVTHLDAEGPEDLPGMRMYGFDHWLASDNNLRIRDKPGWWRGETRVGMIEGFAAAVVSDEVIRWLSEGRDADRPFLLFANYYEPHADSDAPAAMRARYEREGHAPGPARYYACVEHLDLQVGRVLDALDGLGLRDDTLVLFLSDHGPNPTAQSRFGTAAPYRGTKYQVWDGAVHVPAVVRWPGFVEAGSTITQPVGAIDLLQTLAGVAGAEEFLPADRVLDGVDLSPVLRGEAEAVERGTPLQWHYYKSSAGLLAAGSPQAAMRVGDRVVCGWYEGAVAFNNARWMPIARENGGVVEMDYLTGTGTQAGRVLDAERGVFRLYDLAADPHQDTDLFDAGDAGHVAMRDGLIASHAALRAAAPGWGFRSDAPDYGSYAAWRASVWSGEAAEGGAVSGPGADPDGDGRSNAREYAFASDPRAGSAADADGPAGFRLGVAVFDVPGGDGPAAYQTVSFNASSVSSARVFASCSRWGFRWEEASARLVLAYRLRWADGTHRVVYRGAEPIARAGLRLVRLRVDVGR